MGKRAGYKYNLTIGIEQMETENSNKPTKESIFFGFFMNCQKNLYAYILSSVRNYSDAKDIFQETATVLWQKFDEFDQNSNFMAWGISIARNLVRKYFHQHERSKLKFDEKLIRKIEEETLSELNSYDTRVDSLRKCFKELSESNRQLIKLRYEEGLTIKSIAARFGKPLQGMYKYIARLQNALLECIEKTMALNE